jgi:hypothetical protein
MTCRFSLQGSLGFRRLRYESPESLWLLGLSAIEDQYDQRPFARVQKQLDCISGCTDSKQVVRLAAADPTLVGLAPVASRRPGRCESTPLPERMVIVHRSLLRRVNPAGAQPRQLAGCAPALTLTAARLDRWVP